MISKISRSHSNDHSSKVNQTVEQRKSLPSTSLKQQQEPQKSSSSLSTTTATKNTSLINDREAEDIEKLYMQLKAKQSMDKRRK